MTNTTFAANYIHILEALRAASTVPGILLWQLDKQYGKLLIDYVLLGMPFGPDLEGFARWVRAYARMN